MAEEVQVTSIFTFIVLLIGVTYLIVKMEGLNIWFVPVIVFVVICLWLFTIAKATLS